MKLFSGIMNIELLCPFSKVVKVRVQSLDYAKTAVVASVVPLWRVLCPCGECCAVMASVVPLWRCAVMAIVVAVVAREKVVVTPLR